MPLATEQLPAPPGRLPLPFPSEERRRAAPHRIDWPKRRAESSRLPATRLQGAPGWRRLIVQVASTQAAEVAEIPAGIFAEMARAMVHHAERCRAAWLPSGVARGGGGVVASSRRGSSVTSGSSCSGDPARHPAPHALRRGKRPRPQKSAPGRIREHIDPVAERNHCLLTQWSGHPWRCGEQKRVGDEPGERSLIERGSGSSRPRMRMFQSITVFIQRARGVTR